MFCRFFSSTLPPRHNENLHSMNLDDNYFRCSVDSPLRLLIFLHSQPNRETFSPNWTFTAASSPLALVVQHGTTGEPTR